MVERVALLEVVLILQLEETPEAITLEGVEELCKEEICHNEPEAKILLEEEELGIYLEEAQNNLHVAVEEVLQEEEELQEEEVLQEEMVHQTQHQ